jgi:low temperature requirement protein LtrA
MEAVDERAAVTPLELFFDLVFVFALTRVTDWMADDPTLTAVVRGLLILGVMWWSWVGYAWLGNVVRADEGLMRVGLFAASAAVFIAAVAIPEAFDDLPGGLSGPVVFALAYFCVRAVHLGLFWLVSEDDAQLRGQVVRWIPSVVAGTAFLLAASQAHGTAQTLLWAAALVGDYVGTLLAGTAWRLRSPGHFAERHGLIVIVALGESIVSIGIGVAALPVSLPIIAACVLGLAVTGALWWAYFDVTALLAERALSASRGAHRIALARGGYTFLHLPMVVGVIMMSLGLKKVLGYVGGDEGHRLTDPIHGLPLVALYGGAVVYLLAHVAFKAYLTGAVSRGRILTVAALLALVPAVAHLPALGTLAVLAGVLCALVAWETRHYAEERDRIRHAHEH